MQLMRSSSPHPSPHLAKVREHEPPHYLTHLRSFGVKLSGKRREFLGFGFYLCGQNPDLGVVLIRCLVVFLFGGNPRHKNAAKPSRNRGVRESLRPPDPPLRSGTRLDRNRPSDGWRVIAWSGIHSTLDCSWGLLD